MPSLVKVAKEYEGKVVFVGLDVGPLTGLGTNEGAMRLAEELDLPYAVGYAPDATSIEEYELVGIPTTIFFRPDGEITGRHTGSLTEDELRGYLRELLAANP